MDAEKILFFNNATYSKVKSRDCREDKVAEKSRAAFGRLLSHLDFGMNLGGAIGNLEHIGQERTVRK